MNPQAEDQRWRRRGTPQQNLAGNTSQGGQQGPRRNQSHDRNTYSSSGGGGGYQGGGGSVWNNRQVLGQNQQQQQQQQPGLIEEHVPVRGFNSREVSEYLNRGYAAALNAAQNTYTDESSKPMIYKSPEKPWKTTGKAPWASRPNVMANSADFLSQLRKGLAALPPPAKD